MLNLNGSMSGIPMLGVDGCSTAPAIIASSSAAITTTGGLTVATCTATPLTPEILNSVIAMTNPLEYSFPVNSTACATTARMTPIQQKQTSAESDSSGSGSPFDSTGGAPAAVMTEATTPTVQQTCSQLIKTSLKLSLEMKRKTSTGDSSGAETSTLCKQIKQDFDSSDDEMTYKSPRSSSGINLTPEDEDRRRRRRERNKIAATKCRMKKREKTINLVSEAEILDAQNIDLKQQARTLEIERRTLTEMLKSHASSCVRGSFKLPTYNASIAKFIQELGLELVGNKQSINAGSLLGGKSETKSRASQMKVTAPKVQKIPSMTTLKFGARRQSNRQVQNATRTTTMNNTTTAINSGTISSIANSTNCCMPNEMRTSPVECKPLPSIDMGFCEGRNDNLTPTSSYCKSLMSSSSDCYAISSPDSGFIKSPVDMGNYSSIPSMMKSDYIPNCDTSTADLSLLAGTVDGTNGDGSIEFILKSELIEGNDSPYTTVQSADRFLFDGCNEAFEDIDAAANQANYHASHQSLMDHSQQMHAETLKEHLLMQGMNNNNNSSHINNNHNNHLNANHMNSNHLHGNCGDVINSTVITSVMPTHTSSIIEFNNANQQFIDNSFLKGDFSSQNCDFLPFGVQDACDSQFTTDLDSGVTTYTNITNGGCLA